MTTTDNNSAQQQHQSADVLLTTPFVSFIFVVDHLKQLSLLNDVPVWGSLVSRLALCAAKHDAWVSRFWVFRSSILLGCTR